MTSSRMLRRLPLSGALFMSAVSGCHDAMPTVGHAPEPSSAVVRLVVEDTPAGSRFVLRAKVVVGAGLDLPSAFVVRILLPAGVDSTFADVSASNGVLRVMNLVHPELRIAGASAAGIEELFAVEVGAAARDVLADAQLVIDELGDRSGNDLRRALRTMASPVFQGKR